MNSEQIFHLRKLAILSRFSYSLLLRMRATVKDAFHSAPSSRNTPDAEVKSTASQIAMAIMLAALVLFAAAFARAAAVDEMLAKHKPQATIDLATKEGVRAVKGVWRYSDTRIVEVDFKAAAADGQPGAYPTEPMISRRMLAAPTSTTRTGR
jgi:hypothetical protein